MSTNERIADAMVRSTAGMGVAVGRLLSAQPASKRGGTAKTKASRKAARRARRITQRN